MKRNQFGGLTHRSFLARHWQKRPLLARAEMREWSGMLRPAEIFALARCESLESRIVRRTGKRWEVEHGPFSRRDLARMPDSSWTLLVQGIDRAVESVARLRQAFSFIPQARFDDVMVSYAAPGGGVGPHFDSYDVFLLQGPGVRRWRVGRQRDLALVPGAPLRILKRFAPEQTWTVESGDVLYLPPRYAHDGVAIGPCITYSIGFRAPDAQELGNRFLEFLQDRLALTGRYADPDLKPADRSAQLPSPMVTRLAAMLRAVRWDEADVVEFIGRYLSEPMPQVVFARPARAMSARAFDTRMHQRGARLALKTRMLFHGTMLFINGEVCRPGARAMRALTTLADDGELAPGTRLDAATRALLYEWYRAGYVEPGTRRERGPHAEEPS